MNEIAEIFGEKNEFSFNSREIWEKLGIKKEFSNWIKNQIERFNLQENIDFKTEVSAFKGGNIPIGIEEKVGRPEINYYLTKKTARKIVIKSEVDSELIDQYIEHLLDMEDEIIKFKENLIEEQKRITQQQQYLIESKYNNEQSMKSFFDNWINGMYWQWKIHIDIKDENNKCSIHDLYELYRKSYYGIGKEYSFEEFESALKGKFVVKNTLVYGISILTKL